MSATPVRSHRATDTADTSVIEVNDLVKEFPVKAGVGRTRGVVHAVSGVSFAVGPGETLGLVGESGSGKTTVGRCILRLIEPTSGSVRFEGRELVGLPAEELREMRRDMQIVFQDPYASLDPKMTVGASIAEPLKLQKIPGSHSDKVAELLELVGLTGEKNKRAGDLSGGEQARILIARLMLRPADLLILDEPTSPNEPMTSCRAWVK